MRGGLVDYNISSFQILHVCTKIIFARYNFTAQNLVRTTIIFIHASRRRSRASSPTEEARAPRSWTSCKWRVARNRYLQREEEFKRLRPHAVKLGLIRRGSSQCQGRSLPASSESMLGAPPRRMTRVRYLPQSLTRGFTRAPCHDQSDSVTTSFVSG